jgi:hypothetical protein
VAVLHVARARRLALLERAFGLRRGLARGVEAGAGGGVTGDRDEDALEDERRVQGPIGVEQGLPFGERPLDLGVQAD